jgi:hypothetical protein
MLLGAYLMSHETEKNKTLEFDRNLSDLHDFSALWARVVVSSCLHRIHLNNGNFKTEKNLGN